MDEICTVSLCADELVISLCGELDHHAAKDLCRHIDDAIYQNSPKQVVLDLHAVRFMDSAGLGLILGRYRRLCDLGIPFFLRNPNEQVQKILRLAGICRIISVQYTENPPAPASLQQKKGS